MALSMTLPAPMGSLEVQVPLYVCFVEGGPRPAEFAAQRALGAGTDHRWGDWLARAPTAHQWKGKDLASLARTSACAALSAPEPSLCLQWSFL